MGAAKRVLLDENLPHTRRLHLGQQFETFTAAYAGLGGLKNGSLLHAAESANFDILITGGQTLHYEQNLSGRRIAVVVLSATNWPILAPHTPKRVVALKAAVPGPFTRVECGAFSRRSRSRSDRFE